MDSDGWGEEWHKYSVNLAEKTKHIKNFTTRFLIFFSVSSYPRWKCSTLIWFCDRIFFLEAMIKNYNNILFYTNK